MLIFRNFHVGNCGKDFGVIFRALTAVDEGIRPTFYMQVSPFFFKEYG